MAMMMNQIQLELNIKKMNKKFYLIILILFVNQIAYTCSCISNSNIKKAIKKSDLVIIGDVNLIQKIVLKHKLQGTNSYINFHFYKVTVNVEQLYKGKIMSKTIEIITGVGGGDCGFEFKPKKKYVIYASKRNKLYAKGEKIKTFFYTNICKRTTENVDIEKFKIEKFRKPRYN